LPSAVQLYKRRVLRRCVLCSHPEREQYERDWFDRRTTLKEIANDLKCSDSQVSEHMNQHVISATRIELASEYPKELATSVVETIQLLESKAIKFASRLDTLLDMDVGPGMEQALKATSSEFRSYIKDISILKGDIQQAPQVQLQQINIQFDNIKSALLEIIPQMCPRDQELLTNAITRLG